MHLLRRLCNANSEHVSIFKVSPQNLILKFVENIFRCVPHCDGCQNGDCTHPQFCICHAGYDWDSKRNECRPRCPENCPNGVCIAPDVCECNKGYILHPLSNLCIPHCSVPCHNGVCVAPDFCECKHGYHFINDSSTECEATCSFDCKNGKCVRPNVCACNEGYKKHENGHCHCGKFCVEIDDRCHCLDESQRVKGLQLFDTCDEDNCINGKCTSDWHCECLDGFVKNENNTCISNDTCLEGECTPSEDSSAPSRSTILCECINGVCSTNNTCFCIGGYKISNKTANKCVPSCDLECVSLIIHFYAPFFLFTTNLVYHVCRLMVFVPSRIYVNACLGSRMPIMKLNGIFAIQYVM